MHFKKHHLQKPAEFLENEDFPDKKNVAFVLILYHMFHENKI